MNTRSKNKERLSNARWNLMLVIVEALSLIGAILLIFNDEILKAILGMTFAIYAHLQIRDNTKEQ